MTELRYLVPKLRLRTSVEKLRFESVQRREAELRDMRSQGELGNESRRTSKTTIRPILFLTLFSLCSLCLCGDSPAQEAGFAAADITPKLGDKPVYMAGFGNNRKATKVHDPLMARAVVVKADKTKIALASIDVVGFGYPNVLRIRKQLPDFTYVLISSTHNHEGPDTIGLWGKDIAHSGVDADYIAHIESQIVKAVKDADKA